MQAGRVVMEPAPPGPVVRPYRRDEPPEPRTMPEHAQVRELVDHDGLQGRRRGQDQPPRKRQPTLPRRTPPSGSRIAQRDGRRRDREHGRVPGDRCIDGTTGLLAKPTLHDGRVGFGLARDAVDDELPGPCKVHDVGPADAADRRHDPHPVQVAKVRDRASIPCPAALGEDCRLFRLPNQVAPQPRLAQAKELGRPPLPVRTTQVPSSRRISFANPIAHTGSFSGSATRAKTSSRDAEIVIVCVLVFMGPSSSPLVLGSARVSTLRRRAL